MRGRLSRFTSNLMGTPARRWFKTFPDDCLLTSYPRSGNTWLRFMITGLLRPKDALSFEFVKSVIPDIYEARDRDLQRIDRPRILKSHEPYDYRYPKVVYVVRDPRDVAVSYLHYQLRESQLDADAGVDEFITRFVRGDLDSFGPWAAHVESWLPRRYESDFLLIRYEDVLEDPLEIVSVLCSFLALPCDDRLIRSVAARSSFPAMRDMAAGSEDAGVSSPEQRFIRKGLAGAWRQELADAAADMIEREFGSVMAKVGYLDG